MIEYMEGNMGKVTWQDLNSATQQDLKRVYKLDSRGLENAIQKHLYGASSVESRNLYETVYGKRK